MLRRRGCSAIWSNGNRCSTGSSRRFQNPLENEHLKRFMKKFLIILTTAWSLLLSGNALAALQIQSWTLDNGARVAFVENHAIPILDVSVEFDAGARRD